MTVVLGFPCMHIIVADCEVSYEGRLSTRLLPAMRTIIIKQNGSIQIHADHYPPTGFKPLNWMTGGPKTRLDISDDMIVATRGGEQLVIRLLTTYQRIDIPLGAEPGLWAYGTEKEMQAYLASHPYLLGPGMQLIGREFPTPVGPVDLLCKDEQGFVAVEVKRVSGHIRGVDQLIRYLECLRERPDVQPIRALYVAPAFKPQTLEYARQKQIECMAVTADSMLGARPDDFCSLLVSEIDQ